MLETRSRYFQLVDNEPFKLSHTEEDDVSCVVDYLDGFDKSSASRQVQSHNALHTATLIWQKLEAFPIPLEISIMSFCEGEI